MLSSCFHTEVDSRILAVRIIKEFLIASSIPIVEIVKELFRGYYDPPISERSLASYGVALQEFWRDYLLPGQAITCILPRTLDLLIAEFTQSSSLSRFIESEYYSRQHFEGDFILPFTSSRIKNWVSRLRFPPRVKVISQSGNNVDIPTISKKRPRRRSKKFKRFNNRNQSNESNESHQSQDFHASDDECDNECNERDSERNNQDHSSSSHISPSNKRRKIHSHH